MEEPSSWIELLNEGLPGIASAACGGAAQESEVVSAPLIHRATCGFPAGERASGNGESDAPMACEVQLPPAYVPYVPCRPPPAGYAAKTASAVAASFQEK